MENQQIDNWQTYDFTNIKGVRHSNFVLEKLLRIGKILFFFQLTIILSLVFYMLYKNNFEFILISDGTDRICFFDKMVIKSVR